VKLQLPPVSSRRDCYLLSETITPSDTEEAITSDNDEMLTSENNISTLHTAAIIAVPVLVVLLILLLIILSVVVVIRVMKDRRQEGQYVQFPLPVQQPLLGEGEIEGTYNAYTL
jgi:hypothetical protein